MSAVILCPAASIMANESIPVFTVGFTKKKAAEFFEKLRAAGVRRVVDVRLNKIFPVDLSNVHTFPHSLVRRGDNLGGHWSRLPSLKFPMSTVRSCRHSLLCNSFARRMHENSGHAGMSARFVFSPKNDFAAAQSFVANAANFLTIEELDVQP